MSDRTKADLPAVGRTFALPGDYVAGGPYGSGHINDTFRVTYRQGRTNVRYIHQRINHEVFTNPPALMENIHRVTHHIRSKWEAAGAADVARRALTLIPTGQGEAYHQDDAGAYWRTYVFVEGASTHDVLQTPAQAREAAFAFGRFQAQLADLPGPRLHETIPHFHDTPKRLDALQDAVARDVCGRAAGVAEERRFIFARSAETRHLLDLHRAGRIPERVTHNDTKLNNVMLDDTTGEGLCVIDLDTVMPGLALYDFGDMMRTALSPAAEDERDVSKVVARLDFFAALVEGYLAAAGDMLTADECEHLAFSGRLITLEIGIRFLTDYLTGDRYFKIQRPDHNLDRARTQIALVKRMEAQREEMEQAVRRIRAKHGH